MKDLSLFTINGRPYSIIDVSAVVAVLPDDRNANEWLAYTKEAAIPVSQPQAFDLITIINEERAQSFGTVINSTPAGVVRSIGIQALVPGTNMDHMLFLVGGHKISLHSLMAKTILEGIKDAVAKPKSNFRD